MSEFKGEVVDVMEGEEQEEEVKTSSTKKKKKKKSKKKKNSSSLFIVPPECAKYFDVIHDPKRGRYAQAKVMIPAGSVVLREEAYEAIVGPKLCTGCLHSISNDQTARSIHPSVRFCTSDCLNEYQSFVERSGVNQMVDYGAYLDSINEVANANDCDAKLLRITCNILAHMLQDPSKLSVSPLFLESSDKLQSAEGWSCCATSAGCLAQESHINDQPEKWRSTVSAAIRQLHRLQLLPIPSLSEDYVRSQDISNYIIDEREKLANNDCDSTFIVNLALSIASRINVNAYGIVISNKSTEFNREDVGFGVFPLAAMMFNHSCSPNLVNVWIDNRMEYRTVTDVQVGEELDISYIDIRLSTPMRRNILRLSKHFFCTCKRCRSFDLCCGYIDNNDVIFNKVDSTDDDYLYFGNSKFSEDSLTEAMLGGCYCENCGMLKCPLYLHVVTFHCCL